MNFKNIIIALLATFIVSCTKSGTQVFDHAKQYKIEKPIIDAYMATHYYDAVDDELKLIDDKAIETALINDTDHLKTLTVTLNEVNYTMYSYITKVGTEQSPDRDDKVNIAYEVFSLTSGIVYEDNDAQDNFLDLSNLIEGWKTGLTVFKGGTANESDESLPRQFIGSGKGFMIIPSGLGYQNGGQGSIPPNETLIFKITLRLVDKQGEDL